MSDLKAVNEQQAAVWNRNAQFWDSRMNEQHDFFAELIWPASRQLLALSPGQTILDIACGNGVSSRALAQLGAQVVAFDIAEQMIASARSHGQVGPGRIDYQVLDATDADAIRGLGKGRFDAALSCMALMDIADIRPLLVGLTELLRPGGCFVFSICHPCFNNPTAIQMGEIEDRSGELVTTWSVKIAQYKTAAAHRGLAMHGQPVAHTYFHRALEALLGMAFDAGLVLDGLLEPAFPADSRVGSTPFSWNGNYAELPPVLVARLRWLDAS